MTGTLTASFERFGGPAVLDLVDRPAPVPVADQVLVRVRACGVNHLDLDIRRGRSRYDIPLPHTLGREIAGDVVELGDRVAHTRVGDRVLVRAHISCGRCDYCVRGEDNNCPAALLPGVNIGGGYTELVAVPERGLVPLPEVVSHVDAAATQIAFGTAWHALVRLARVPPGSTVLVTGAAGGVGTAALQVAAGCGATVIAAAGSAARVARCLAAGADAGIDYRAESLVDGVRRIGRPVDYVCETAGGEIFQDALAALAVGGTMIVVGAHAGEVVPLDLVELFRREIRVVGARRATTADVRSVLRLVGEGVLTPTICEVRPLPEVREVHQRLESRDGFGKWVLTP
ncbi:MAG: alcohol dehydrogenase catalytic domain-containing protein [Micromonosporaceae bacterium]|nr:alcohol dehydrogenase catalytic domain-containing protein [Micromonosporaceae bacterium]